jgi:hypothetical protein
VERVKSRSFLQENIMSFNVEGWNVISRSTTAPHPVFFTYSVNELTGGDQDDTLATISASGFFNSMANNLNEDDLIYAVGSDSSNFYRVSSANGVTPVTISAINFVPAGSITNADIASNANIVPSKLATSANYKVICIPISFVAAQQTTHTLYFPMAVTVTAIRAFVTTSLAATDPGVVTCKNNAGTPMANGTVTIPASSAPGIEVSVSPTSNDTFTAGQKMQLTCSKVTSGGAANIYISFYTTG